MDWISSISTSRRKAVRMPIGLPATRGMVRFAAHYLLRTDPELILFGRYVVSKRLKELGFEFDYSDINAAFKNLIRGK